MSIVSPTPETFKAFMKTEYDNGPIIGINLLRYRDRASYKSGVIVDGGTDVSGREAYRRYWAVTKDEVTKVGGVVELKGSVLFPLIVPEGEQWDDVVNARYPSRDAFIEMQKSPTYQACLHHRTAGLADTRLVFVSPSELFR